MNTFRISRELEAYIGDSMREVSRSFALVVPYAEPPLNHYLATAYLLCRVVDNVEDCLQPFDWKQVRFSEILHLLREPQAAAEVLSFWRSENWPGLTLAECIRDAQSLKVRIKLRREGCLKTIRR